MQDEDVWNEKKSGRYGIGFIDPNTINEYTWKLDPYYKKSIEDNMLEFLKRLKYNEDILLPYNFQWVTLSCTTNSLFLPTS